MKPKIKIIAYDLAQDMWSRGIDKFDKLACKNKLIEKFGENIGKEIDKVYNENHKKWDLEMEQFFINQKTLDK